MNQLVRIGTGEIIVHNLLVRSTPRGRARGLLAYRSLKAGSGMLLIGARRVHTLGMLFPLDLYFFDKSLRFLGSRRGIQPWRLPSSPADTRHILEIHHRIAAGHLPLRIFDRVSIVWRLTP